MLVFSDLMDREEKVLKRLGSSAGASTRSRSSTCSIPAELEFPFEDPTLFLSMEDERQVEANGRDMRKGYLELFRRWLDDVRRLSLESDVDYALCRTDTPVDKVLLPFLARRERTAA